MGGLIDLSKFWDFAPCLREGPGLTGASESGLRARVVGTVASGSSRYLTPASPCGNIGLVYVLFSFLPIHIYLCVCEISQF